MIIKAVILDFGGTLADGSIDWDEYHRAIQGLLKGLGFSVKLSRLKRAISASLERLERVRARGDELTLEEVYAHALSRLGVPAEEETLRMIHDLFRAHFKTTLLPGVEEVLGELSERYRLALLSNTMSDTPRIVLQRTGLIDHFDLVVCSSDLGIRKPNPRIFHYVLERLGVEAGEAVHVGDSVEADMEGASRAGIRGIWIRGSEPSSWNGPVIESVSELPKLLTEMDDDPRSR
ncbi:MAG: HAD family hydrolase [Candidatus Bathyarchaeia archaeon]